MAWRFSKFLTLIFFISSMNPGWGRSYKNFPQVKAKIGAHVIPKLYLAVSNEDRSLGLMNVSKIDDKTGVLFVFEKTQPLSFWMKNTYVPLTIGFFDSKGCLLETLDMEPVSSVLQAQIPQYQSSDPARFALEVRKGWFQSNKIKGGEALHLLELPANSTSLSPNSLKTLKRLLQPAKCSTGKRSKAS